MKISLNSHRSEEKVQWDVCTHARVCAFSGKKAIDWAYTELHSGESVNSLVNADFTIWKWSCYMFTRVLTKKIDYFQIAQFVGMDWHLEKSHVPSCKNFYYLYPFIEACRDLEDHRFQLLIKSLRFLHSKIKPRRILPMLCTIHSYFPL